MFTKEISLSQNYIPKESWAKFIEETIKLSGPLNKITITCTINNNFFKYYITTKHNLPSKITNTPEFTLQDSSIKLDKYHPSTPLYQLPSNNLINIYEKFSLRHQTLTACQITITPITTNFRHTKIYLFFKSTRRTYRHRLLFNRPENLLSIDFNNLNFFYRKLSDYLDIQKNLHLLKSDKEGSILKIETFPYLSGEYYLNLQNYSFNKHSILIGSSGCGKSKLISLIISKLNQNIQHRLKYRVVVIDPHASLEHEIGGLYSTIVYNFKTPKNSVNLFIQNQQDPLSSVELTLPLLKNILNEQYNAKIERLLRHSIYLLVSANSFNFTNLKNILLKLEYRHQLLKEHASILPESIIEFFSTDFNDYRTKYYNETIAPLISFIDELTLIPSIGELNTTSNDVANSIHENFLNIFSLDATKLGEKATKTIAGLLMSNIFKLAESQKIKEEIILVIDEISVIENPILLRILSESRKYGISLIIAEQYFSQVSTKLQDAIFANVANYYIFKVSKNDAVILENNIQMKLLPENTVEKRIKFIYSLNNRECLVRICNNDIFLPAFKARTLDYEGIPYNEQTSSNANSTIAPKKYTFTIKNSIKESEINKRESTSRKDVQNHEQ